MGCCLIPETIANRTLHRSIINSAQLICFILVFILLKQKNKKWNCLIFLIFYTPEGYSLHNRSNPRMAFQMVVRCPSPNSSRKLGRMFKSLRKAVILSFSLLTLKNNQITLNFIFEELFLFLQLTCLCLRTLENI